MVDRPTIFILDDDAAVRDSLKEFLESTRLRVETFSLGEQILARIPFPEPGCAILDIDVPGMTGLEVLETLAEKGIKTPVILMTGKSNAAIKARAARAGAAEVLEKPLLEKDLLAAIRRALKRRSGNPKSRR